MVALAAASCISRSAFLDFEPGIHFSQFQMQSGTTGINTVRIYSPIKQVKDQDPSGEFIKRYVPELTGVSEKHIAEPHKMTLDEQNRSGCWIGKIIRLRSWIISLHIGQQGTGFMRSGSKSRRGKRHERL